MAASGRGTLHAFTIVHRAPAREFQADVPYVVALIDLDEGVRLLATLVEVAPDPVAVRIGARVEIVYDDVTPDVTLPRFRFTRPDEGHGRSRHPAVSPRHTTRATPSATPGRPSTPIRTRRRDARDPQEPKVGDYAKDADHAR
jgi:hypothetical protein